MGRHSSLMVSRVSTEDSPSLPLVSSSTVACTSVSTIHSSLSCSVKMLELVFPSFSGGCHCHSWPDVLPHRHRQKAHDDDLRWRSEVQGFHGLLHAGGQECRVHVPDEGSRS